MVTAVVVTYNRSKMLMDCLRALNEESLVNTILVVNNGSTDDTAELLNGISVQYKEKLKVFNLEKNTGGAGGFRFGIDKAINLTDCPWIWCMDDDVEPEVNCLENLLKYSKYSRCIHPLVKYQDGEVHEWEHFFDPNTTIQIGLKNKSFKNDKEWTSMNVACFEGMLIHREIVERIGFPHEDFFIYGDDGHYGFLASMHTNLIYVRDAVLKKKIKPTGANTEFKIYYDIRNRFLLRKKIRPLIETRKYDKFIFLMFMVFHSYSMIQKQANFRKINALYFAWKDGLSNSFGKSNKF